MSERRQLPPQIRRVELTRRAGGKPTVRYKLTVDTGYIDGKREQLRRRYATEKEARVALAEALGQVATGNYVHPSTVTVEQACAEWLLSRHNIKPTTAAGYEYMLQPVRTELGEKPVQKLTRRDIDDLLRKLQDGGLRRPDGSRRKPWSPRSCNYMVTALRQVLAQLVAEGYLTRNIALLVDRVPGKAKRFETFTAKQVQVVLDGISTDRNRHAWHMALAGMRRGEITGQRWADVDFTNKLIGRTRVDVRGHALDQTDPKTKSAARILPIPDGLLAELKAAKARQAAEQLAMGDAYSDHGHVVCNEAGEPYHPSTLTKLWSAAIRDLDVPQVRLHDARHTCATLMHLENVPIAMVAAWLGHTDVSFTLRTYVHAQPDALLEAAQSLTRSSANTGD